MSNTLTQEQLRMRKSIIIYIIVYRYKTDITNPVENMIRLDPSQLSTAWTQDVLPATGDPQRCGAAGPVLLRIRLGPHRRWRGET